MGTNNNDTIGLPEPLDIMIMSFFKSKGAIDHISKARLDFGQLRVAVVDRSNLSEGGSTAKEKMWWLVLLFDFNVKVQEELWHK